MRIRAHSRKETRAVATLPVTADNLLASLLPPALRRREVFLFGRTETSSTVGMVVRPPTDLRRSNCGLRGISLPELDLSPTPRGKRHSTQNLKRPCRSSRIAD